MFRFVLGLGCNRKAHCRATNAKYSRWSWDCAKSIWGVQGGAEQGFPLFSETSNRHAGLEGRPANDAEVRNVLCRFDFQPFKRSTRFES